MHPASLYIVFICYWFRNWMNDASASPQRFSSHGTYVWHIIDNDFCSVQIFLDKTSRWILYPVIIVLMDKMLASPWMTSRCTRRAHLCRRQHPSTPSRTLHPLQPDSHCSLTVGYHSRQWHCDRYLIGKRHLYFFTLFSRLIHGLRLSVTSTAAVNSVWWLSHWSLNFEHKTFAPYHRSSQMME